MVRFDPILACVCLVATFGVTAITLAPSRGEDVFAVFDPSDSPETILERVERSGLAVSFFDPVNRHVIVSNPMGDSGQRLVTLGASFVIDARFASFCSSRNNSPDNRSFAGTGS